MQALGEVEFFLGSRPEETDIYGATERGYHASSPFVFGEPLRRRAMVMLAEIGIPVKYGHSEVGYIPADEVDERIWEQHEIELALLPMPQAADAVLIAQWLLRNLAHKAGWRCSFDPILRQAATRAAASTSTSHRWWTACTRSTARRTGNWSRSASG